MGFMLQDKLDPFSSFIRGRVSYQMNDLLNVVECHGYDTAVNTFEDRDQCIFGGYTIKNLGNLSVGEQFSPL